MQTFHVIYSDLHSYSLKFRLVAGGGLWLLAQPLVHSPWNPNVLSWIPLWAPSV